MKTLITLAALWFAAACAQPKAVQKPAEPALFKPDPVTAASVSGTIRYKGNKPPRKPVDMGEDPLCAKMHKTGLFEEPVAVSPAGTLANVFVYVKTGLEGKKFETPAEPVTMDQNGCWFQPRVAGIQTGQQFKVTNSDPVTHNIHPRPHANREWNQSQGPGEAPLTRKFARPEVMIRVKCNVHGWMHAWIGVVEHPYHVVTGADGSFSLKGLPPGTYTIEAWHEALGVREGKVTLSPSQSATLDLNFEEEKK